MNMPVANAALAVLTDLGLLQHITSFQEGLPYVVGQVDASLEGDEARRVPGKTASICHSTTRPAHAGAASASHAEPAPANAATAAIQWGALLCH
ncbi:unnamed protein product [Phytophthora lilii]|uniref:Unnamed protein product n=1 Tax=Phytophthora lilii TaxID=2077276 RepID=A0A9W7CIX7_9STRA|nr:unnamed protein product [Phytophthora lilii]